MKEQLKVELDKTLQHLKEAKDVIADKTREIPEETQALWENAKEQLSAINDKLNEALNRIETKTDEAHLQAHLATMEAHRIWDRTRSALEDFIDKSARQTRSEIDQAALQAHLAKMDAEDFMEARGNAIARNFEHSRDKVEKTTLAAVKELNTYFGKIGKALSKK